MAKELSVEDAIERARRAQENRLDAIRELAEKRQTLADAHAETALRIAAVQRAAAEQIREAEHSDVKSFNAAIAAGWSVDELRRIGFAEPMKKVRARRRAPASNAQQPSDQSDG